MRPEHYSAPSALHRRWEIGNVIVFACDETTAKETASIAEKRIDCMGSEALASGKFGHWQRSTARLR